MDPEVVLEKVGDAGWSVRVEADPSIDRAIAERDGLEIPEYDRVVVERGDETMYFSPSYTEEELAKYLVEHDLSSDHAAGLHDGQPVFECPECRLEVQA